MSRRTIVFGKTKKRACEKLNEMLGDMLCSDVKEVKNNGREMVIRATNGDMYEIAVANESSKGKRCDYAYVDKDIELEILSTIVLPCLQRNKNKDEENLFVY